MKLYYITIGDWSEDGHNRYDIFSYQANKPLPEQREALLLTEQRTGVYVSGLAPCSMNGNPNLICQNYKEGEVTAFHIEMLRRYVNGDGYHACDCGPNGMRPNPQEMAKFVLGLIEISLPGFQFTKPEKVRFKGPKYSETEDTEFDKWFKASEKQRLNGWWGPSVDSPLNHGFGYGIYENGLFSWDGDDEPSFRRNRGLDRRHLEDPWEKFGAATWLGERSKNLMVIKACPYEIDVHAFNNAWHRRSVKDGEKGCEVWQELVEVAKTHFRGKMFRIWNRLFFSDKTDATLASIHLMGADMTIRVSERVEREVAGEY